MMTQREETLARYELRRKLIEQELVPTSIGGSADHRADMIFERFWELYKSGYDAGYQKAEQKEG